MRRPHTEAHSAEQDLLDIAMSVGYAEQGIDGPVTIFTNLIPVCNAAEFSSFTSCLNTIGSIPCDSISHA